VFEYSQTFPSFFLPSDYDRFNKKAVKNPSSIEYQLLAKTANSLTAKSILTSAGSPFNPILFLLYKRALAGGNIIDMILSDRVDLHMPVFQLTEKIVFPRPDLAEKNGLLAIGGDLSPERLIVAYRSGIFPWYSQDDPILWWCTSPRLVIFPNEFKIPKRLYRDIKKPLYRITMDHSF
jgi:hypothetical protein